MEYQKYYLVLFHSRNYAIAVESVLKRQGIEVELFDAPKKLARNCNLAIKFNEEVYTPVIKELKMRRSQVFKVYLIVKQNGNEMLQSIIF